MSDSVVRAKPCFVTLGLLCVAPKLGSELMCRPIYVLTRLGGGLGYGLQLGGELVKS